MPEILSIDQYPQINWSKEEIGPEGDPVDTHGLIGLRIGPNGWRMDYQHLLTPYYAKNQTNSLLMFGHPGYTKIWVYSCEDKLFDLEDPDRINQAGIFAQNLLTADRQMIAARKVIEVGQTLLETVRQIAAEEDPNLLKEAGIIDDFIKSQEEKLQPGNILVAARNLVVIGVKEVRTEPSRLHRSGFDIAFWPSWIIEKYSQQTSDTKTA